MRSKLTYLMFLIVCAVALSNLSVVRADNAKPFLHPLFTDNMVLQRDISDPVWGWTTPGQTVTVQIAGKSASAVAGADGEWMARLPKLKPGGPYTLTVTGPQTVTLQQVMVGDVWICSGQSNMVFGVGAAIGGQDAIASSTNPLLRLFTVGNVSGNVPLQTVSGQWLTCNPQNVGNGGWQGFSAVGYFFGRDLQQNIHIPVGLILSAWSGTPAEAWTSTEALSTIPDFASAISDFNRTAAAEQNGTTYDQLLDAWYARNDPGSAPGSLWSDPAVDTTNWKPVDLSANWGNSGVPEIANGNCSVWYDREFDLPSGWSGKDLVLHLGRIAQFDTTYVNGQKVGESYMWWQGRDYNVPNALLKPSGNVIRIHVLSISGGGSGFEDPVSKICIQPQNDTTTPPLALAGQWRCKFGATVPATDPIPEYIDNQGGLPTSLYNGMISPLIPFGIKGAIWYQGESNAGNAKQYQVLLPTMIKDWRTRFGCGDFPFMIVQIANYGKLVDPVNGADWGSGWAELRWAQLLTSERVPNTGLAVTIDIGDANDIHPKDKADVGQRLADSAEALVYGRKMEYSGPLYQGIKVEGSTIRVLFSHISGGLVAKGTSTLTGFAIAGKDDHFVWADAKIDGNTIVVSSPTVPAPVAVRYAWADNPACNLYNQAGFPAPPFQSDATVVPLAANLIARTPTR